jgi:hypothetical protein
MAHRIQSVQQIIIVHLGICHFSEGWVRYFQNLSKRLESDNFNAKYQEFVQLDYKEIEDFCRNNSC